MVTIGLGYCISLNFIFSIAVTLQEMSKSPWSNIENITSYNPNQNKSQACILRLQYPLSKHIHHVFSAIQGYLVPLCEVLCTSQGYHLYNQ